MYHSKHVLDQMHGERKVMFFLTDGAPNDGSDIVKVKTTVNEMRASGYSVLGIGIGMDSGYDGSFKEMFGNGWVACPNLEDVERVLKTDFVNQVSKFLRRG